MIQAIPLSDFRTEMPQIIAQIPQTPIVLTQHGKPKALLRARIQRILEAAQLLHQMVNLMNTISFFQMNRFLLKTI